MSEKELKMVLASYPLTELWVSYQKALVLPF